MVVQRKSKLSFWPIAICDNDDAAKLESYDLNGRALEVKALCEWLS